MKGHSSKALRIQRHDEVDAEVGDALVEVEIGLDSRRALSGALMKLAYLLGEKPGSRGFLVLVDSAITLPRLREEWARSAQVLRPEIQQRLHICLYQTDTILGVPTEPDAGLQRIIREVVSREQSSAAALHQPRSAKPFYDILRILINQWIKLAGPLTSRWLGEAAGCTYPTVASALEKLEKYLVRHSDRRVELKAFPRDEWFRLVANADKVRQTLRFADHSGEPRSVESLVSRLQKLHLEGVAIAGVLGARRLYPALDLIGTPRLDLTLHCRARQPDIGFLRQLDPALKPAAREEPARLVIHLLRYPHRFSETDAEGILWADPVECLLDLHEMRLESQAMEFLQALSPKRQTHPEPEQEHAMAALTELFNEVKGIHTHVIVERIVADIDGIVRQVRFDGWQATVQGEREVKQALRRALLKYKLHTDHDLFDRAYGYIRQYY